MEMRIVLVRSSDTLEVYRHCGSRGATAFAV
jgi:hypothetical protein